MTTPIRWGIMGTGGMAAAFVHDVSSLPDARIEAVGSRNAATAANFAARLHIPRSHGSYAELAEDPNIDVVYIATINSTHRELCLRCLEAGKPVLCEKPFALNAAQAGEIVACARRRGLFCMEAMWMRFLPGILRLKQLVDEGVIGKARILTAQIGYPFVRDPAGRQFNAEAGGGSLLDLGVYPISLAFFLFGQPESVVGRATLTKEGVDDTAAIILGFPQGRSAVLSVSLDTLSSNEAVVEGTNGQIRVRSPFFHPHRLEVCPAVRLKPGAKDSGRLISVAKKLQWLGHVRRCAEPMLRLLRGNAVKRIAVPFSGTGYRYEAQEVMRCLQGKQLESATMPLDESVRILETMDELRRQWGIRFPGE
jgi:predicted dehydrogenase